mgnify:CR=1 FL=1
MDGAVRLLDGRAVQLGAQAGLDIGQILLPQGLLLGLFGGVLGAGAAWALCALLGSLGYADVKLTADLFGKPRITEAVWK